MPGAIPAYVEKVYQTLQEAGFEVYLVGGCVRDLLLKRKTKDWDLTTDATPQEILKLFSNGFYDNDFGTVGIPIEDDQTKSVVEVTTFRSESEYKDKRHPESVTWGKTIEEDLQRRDFTINAMALKLKTENRKQKTDIIDPYNGQADLESKLIRAVGDANQRFKEDALRLLRAVRFATQLSFIIEEKTWSAITQDAKLLSHISGERVRIELLRMLASDHPYEGIMMLKNAGLLEIILPELLEGVDISQVRPGRHHTTDVFTHNVMSLKFCTSNDPVVRFATLLHDAGKPKVAGKDEQGLVTFYNHEIVGAKIAKDICDRLHFSKKDREKVVTLIRWHMFSVNENLSDAGIRRFIRRIGVENVKDMMDLRVGDRLGGGTQTAESWRLKLFKKRVEEQLQPAPFSINDLAIDGNDVMKELKMKPGPKVGEILQKLFEEVDEDLSKNTREYLLEKIKTLA
ncbi:MAG TPA: HD domain-containing protein [Candidatus Saccharimonadales bacterium]|nr:HD domain-containing protein [Candidatus Saccharimonadales bacterium]